MTEGVEPLLEPVVAAKVARVATGGAGIQPTPIRVLDTHPIDRQLVVSPIVGVVIVILIDQLDPHRTAKDRLQLAPQITLREPQRCQSRVTPVEGLTPLSVGHLIVGLGAVLTPGNPRDPGPCSELTIVGGEEGEVNRILRPRPLGETLVVPRCRKVREVNERGGSTEGEEHQGETEEAAGNVMPAEGPTVWTAETVPPPVVADQHMDPHHQPAEAHQPAQSAEEADDPDPERSIAPQPGVVKHMGDGPQRGDDPLSLGAALERPPTLSREVEPGPLRVIEDEAVDRQLLLIPLIGGPGVNAPERVDTRYWVAAEATRIAPAPLLRHRLGIHRGERTVGSQRQPRPRVGLDGKGGDAIGGAESERRTALPLRQATPHAV